MDSVLEFDSSSPAEETPEAKSLSKSVDYAQIFQAAAHDLGVAENAFARCAKYHLKEALGEVKYLTDPNLPANLQVLSMTIALRPDYVSIPNIHTYPFTAETIRLRKLVLGMAQAILSTKPGKDEPTYDGDTLYLVGALTTSITNVGNGSFNFTLKQKWSF